jgi:CHAD domain-containing protein
MLPAKLERLELPQIRPALFAKHFNKSAKRVEAKVQDYLIDATEENIHDVRTSIRRLDSSIRILPKAVRNKAEISSSREGFKSLFKINSAIRDMDIIRSKFSEYPERFISQYPSFLETLQEHREAKLKEAREMALSLYNLEVPKIKKGNLPKKKLRRRYRKVANRFVDEAGSLFPLVISDAERRLELHQVRKDCKKLRYSFEATGENFDDDKNNKSDVKGAISLLEGMQDILGAIHDCDIMLLHLARAKGGRHAGRTNEDVEDGKGDYSELMRLEQKERAKLYSEFVSKYGNSDGRTERQQQLFKQEARNRLQLGH